MFRDAYTIVIEMPDEKRFVQQAAWGPRQGEICPEVRLNVNNGCRAYKNCLKQIAGSEVSNDELTDLLEKHYKRTLNEL